MNARQCALCLTLALGGASAAKGADFVFSVPVRLESISPQNASGVIECNVVTIPPPGRDEWPSGHLVVGIGRSAGFTLTRGAYQGTVTVSVNTNPGKSRADARGYVCRLVLDGFICSHYGTVGPEPCRQASAAGNAVEAQGAIKAQ